MIEQFPPPFSISHHNFAVSAQIGLVKKVAVKKCWGLINGHVSLNYPEVVERAYTHSAGDVTYVMSGFIETNEGRKLFAEYLVAIKKVRQKYKMSVDVALLQRILDWTLSITVVDQTASAGYRDIMCMENTDELMTSLENTLNALRRTSQNKVAFILNNDEEESDIYDQYLFCGEYMAIEGDVVKLHFYDFNDEDFEVLHKVALDKAAFTSALLRVYTQLKKQLEDVCKAIEVDFKQVNQLLQIK
jgi:hypothetical protein